MQSLNQGLKSLTISSKLVSTLTNKLLVLSIMLLSISTITIANTSSQTFDDQRPVEISDGKWSSLKAAVQEAKLLPTPVGLSDANSQFGTSVSVDGNRALIGAPNTSGHGVAYIMEFIAGSWVETKILIPADGAQNDQFGWSVSLSGDRALVGAYHDDDNGTDSGFVYIF